MKKHETKVKLSEKEFSIIHKMETDYDFWNCKANKIF